MLCYVISEDYVTKLSFDLVGEDPSKQITTWSSLVATCIVVVGI